MKLRIAMAFALASFAGFAAAQDAACNKAESARAEKAVDSITGWAQLTKAWQQYARCDAGAVADNFTDAFVRLLVAWKDVDGAADAWKNPGLRAFMQKHLKDPNAKEDLDAIYSRARKSCPAKHESFCGELGDFAKVANGGTLAPATASAAPAAPPPAAMTPASAPAPAASSASAPQPAGK